MQKAREGRPGTSSSRASSGGLSCLNLAIMGRRVQARTDVVAALAVSSATESFFVV